MASVVGVCNGMTAGMGACGVAECDAGGVGSVVAVVGDMLFSPPSSGDDLPSGVTTSAPATLARSVESSPITATEGRKRGVLLHRTPLPRRRFDECGEEDPPIAASKEEEGARGE